MRWQFGSRGQRGDTIVEVLIAVAVISLVLGGAYTATNRSLQSSRSAQEQSAAIKVVESQLEQLKGLADKPGGLSSLPLSFCLITSASGPVPTATGGPTNPCGLNAQGVTAGTNDQPVYQIAITQPSTNTFQLRSTWTDVSGNATNSVQMSYRVYPQ